KDISNGGQGSKDITSTVESLEKMERNEELQSVSSEEIIKTGALQTIEKLDEFELSILNESIERGYFNYEITVILREDCVLKGARAFMVFDVLEKLGEIIKAEPPVSDLEEENFDSSFTIILVSQNDTEEIKAKIEKVSEIEQVIMHPFSTTPHKNEKKEQDEEVSLNNPKNDLVQKNSKNKSKKRSANNGTPTKTIRVNIDRLDALMNLFEELVVDRGRLEQISMDLNHQELQQTVERMSRVSSDLQNVILNMRMVPVDQVFNRFPSMIRSLSRDLHKNVDINIIGAETELDRTVIDEIGDPLIHLLRNAVDHGLETPDVRKSLGKSEKGTIQLEAFHSGNHVFIEISDDGKGINKDAVLNKAIKNGIVSDQQSESLTDQEIYELILSSGFSTAEEVSDISGRGVGLDVVKNTIESLGGSISIESKYGEGTTFSIQLPLTLSIISIMLVEIEKEKYALPLSSIIETVIIHKEDVFPARNKKVIDYRGNIVPLVFLKELFSVTRTKEANNDYLSIVSVKKGEKLAVLVVDSFIGQQEVVLKSLGNYLTNVFAISGATILGNGQVALIIDSNALVK